MEAFNYYPEPTDPDFDIKLYRKKEFYDTRVPADIYKVLDTEEEKQKYLQERCGSNFFRLQNYQQFVRNYISPATPYRGLLLYHGVGSGKCLLPNAVIHLTNSVTTDPDLESKISIEELWSRYHSDEIMFDECDQGEWSTPARILMIYTLDQQTGRMINYPINRLYRQHINEPIRVLELASGQIIKLTLKHHLLTENGWSNDFETNHYISRSNSETDTNIELIKIAKSYTEHYIGYVYDLEVKNHHNYVADSIICHNTCAAVQIAEGFKDDVSKQGQKITLITSKQLLLNFQKNLYDFSRESTSTAPGQNQCTGSTYYIPPGPNISDAKRSELFKNKQSEYYDYYTYIIFFKKFEEEFGTSPDFDTNKEDLERLIEIYDNTLYIIDEAQLMIIQKDPAKKSTDEEYDTDTVAKAQDTVAKAKDADTVAQAEDTEVDEEIAQIYESKKQEKAESEEAQKLYGILIKFILKYCKNIRIILLTATPMRNDPMDLVKLLNLLRMNDYKKEKELIQADLFEKVHNADIDNPINPAKAYDVEYLKKLSIGYVSYVRGENPLTFARKVFAGDYKDQSRPIFDNYQKQILMNLNKKDQDLLRMPYYLKYAEYVPTSIQAPSLMEPMKKTLIKCPMSAYQYYYYLLREGNNRNIFMLLRPALIVLPHSKHANGEFVAKLPAGSKDAFNINKDGWSFKPNLKPPQLSELIFSENNLKNISSKFSELVSILSNPTKSQGTHYIYTFLVDESAKIIGAILEYYGYKPYDPKKSPTYILAKDSQQNNKDLLRCYCGCVYKDHDQCLITNKLPPHKFRQATYLLYSSGADAFNANALSVFNTKKNINGELIKVIIGTKAASVGVDYKRIRHMHIMNPWDNSAEIEQTIGRAIRQCAHFDLPIEEQKVTVYHYTATPPKFSEWEQIFQNSEPKWLYWKTKFNELLKLKNHNKFTSVNQFPMRETIDELQYRRSYIKERYIKYVERAIKEIAVDCNFNYFYNIYPDDTDFLGTEITEYQEDLFKCQAPSKGALDKGALDKGALGALGETGISESLIPLPSHLYEKTYKFEELDLDTFRSNRYFIEPILREIQNNIMNLYQKNYVLDLKTIEDLVFKQYQYDIVLNKTLQREYLHLALSQLVGNNETTPIELLDQYNRRGFLIFRDPYYVFHPIHIRDSRLPIYYRQQRITDPPINSINLETAMAIIKTPQQELRVDDLMTNIKNWSDQPISPMELNKLKHNWDLTPLNEQKKLLEEAIPALDDNPNSTFLKELIEHFRYQLLILKVDSSASDVVSASEVPVAPTKSGHWYHGFDKAILKLNRQTKKWEIATENDLNALYDPATSLINKHPYYIRTYGELKSNISSGAKKLNRDAFLKKKTPPIIGIFGKKHEKFNFFIIDLSKMDLKNKKNSDAADNRGMLSGLVCNLHNKDSLNTIYDTLSTLSKNLDTTIWDNEINPILFTTSITNKISKDLSCLDIEYLLRYIDKTNTDNSFYILNQISYDFTREARSYAEIIYDQITTKNQFINGYVTHNSIY